MKRLNSNFVGQKSAFVLAFVGLGIQPAFADSPWNRQKQPIIQGCDAESMSTLTREFPSSKWMKVDLVACLPFQSSSYGDSEPVISPNDAMVVRWHEGGPSPLEIAGIGKPDYKQIPNEATIRGFGRSYGARAALAWSEDSASLWTVRFSPGVLGTVPVRVGIDGKASALPALQHSAGPLNGLQWIGRKGLALARFGPLKEYEWPDHPDQLPTYAIVDGKKGKIRATLSMAAIPDLSEQTWLDAARFANAVPTATLLQNGNVRVVLQYGQQRDKPGFRIVWTEGSQPLIWRDYDDNRSESKILLSPDGSRLLVNRVLQPAGVQIFDCDRGGRHRECSPPPTPVAGPMAELFDVESQKRIWQVSARATVFWSQNANPAISPDGRLALVEMPSDDKQRIIGLISMADGKVLNQFVASYIGSMPIAFGFMTNSKHAWIMRNGIFIRYRIIGRPA